MNSTETDTLKIEVHEEPAWRRVIDVEVPAAEVDAAYEEAYKAFQKQAKVPGFRPGKVPRSMIAKRFGPDVYREVLQTLVPRTLTRAYQQHKLAPLTDPKLSNLELKEGQPFRYRAEIEVRPELDPQGYTGMVLQKARRTVNDDEVGQTVERIRERHATLEASAEPSRRGDVVVCDLEETTADRPEGERQTMSDVTLELNPERVFPEFADGLLGVKPGETRSVTITYPDSYGNEKLAGRKVEFKVAVKDVQVRKLPALDDEFFKGLAADINNLDDLKGRVRADLEAQAEQETVRELNNEIMTQVVTKNAFEVPASLIDDYLSRLHEDLKKQQPDVTREQVEAQYKELGLRQVRWEFLYHAIADKEGVTVTDEDVNAWLERFARSQGVEVEQARQHLAGAGQVARIKDNILETKVLGLLRDKSTITELAVSGSLIKKPGDDQRT